jgi:hypothetical protein
MRCASSRCLVLFTSLILCTSACAADEPATAPAQSATDTLDHGAIDYAAPASPQWKLIGKRSDDLSAGYRAEDQSEIVIVAAPQKQAIQNGLGAVLAKRIKETVQAEAAKGNIEIIEQPKVEPDDRFLLRMRDKFKAQGKTIERLELFNGVGKNLISVTIKSLSDDADQTKKIFEAGEEVMLSIRTHRPGEPPPRVPTHLSLPHSENKVVAATTKPVTYPEARLRVSPPAGWRAESTGNSSGLIVTWRDPNDETNLIMLTYRPIPDDAKKDPKLRALAVEQTAAGEHPSFNIEGGEAGPTQTITDRRFLHKTRTDYNVKGTNVRVSFRQVHAGDGVASVTSVSLTQSADDVDALADKVASEVRATR